MTQTGRLSNPYLYETLKLMISQKIVVQTEKSIQQGILTTVLPDHIVIEIEHTPFFIRMEEIIWVTMATK
ncbi:DUF2642 domain-containing protein [Lysinibacillus sp. JNUCC-52]|uniref:DUF2642 domain-containing protein n=1 Tax=Lysinibacillus sp. JNUCC-52 TaxID=2792480 RepID=UPI001934E8FD|nr:YuzF family protein [Lysinibacillus sp. JNUCC-52]